jgi:hypothetical protein
VLTPDQTTISRWLWPDVLRGQDTSVAKAKKAIADYRKAEGQPHGLAELTVLFCEVASGFAADVGMDDESYLGARVKMCEQALKAVAVLVRGIGMLLQAVAHRGGQVARHAVTLSR